MKDKIEIEIKRLKEIAEFYEFPLAVFFGGELDEIMTELKTLRDIMNNFPLSKMEDGKIFRTDMADELKQEAIKHYKYYFYMALNCKEEEKLFAQLCLGQCSFIREFFNLTEEDLK